MRPPRIGRHVRRRPTPPTEAELLLAGRNQASARTKAARVSHEQLGDERLDLRGRRPLRGCCLRRARRHGGMQPREGQPPLLKLAVQLNQKPDQEFSDRLHAPSRDDPTHQPERERVIDRGQARGSEHAMRRQQYHSGRSQAEALARRTRFKPDWDAACADRRVDAAGRRRPVGPAR